MHALFSTNRCNRTLLAIVSLLGTLIPTSGSAAVTYAKGLSVSHMTTLNLARSDDPRLKIVAVDESAPGMPAFLIKHIDRPELHALYTDGSSRSISLEVGLDLIAFLPSANRQSGYIAFGLGVYHTEVVVYCWELGGSTPEPILRAADPEAIKPKAPGDFLLYEDAGPTPQLLIISQKYGVGQSGSVSSYDLRATGAQLRWTTDRPLFSNPRPLFLHHDSSGTWVAVDNRSFLALVDPATGHVRQNVRYSDSPLSFDGVDGYWTKPLEDGITYRLTSDPYNKFIVAMRIRNDGMPIEVWSRYYETGYENQQYAINFYPQLIATANGLTIPVQVSTGGKTSVELLNAATGSVESLMPDARLVAPAAGDDGQLLIEKQIGAKKTLQVFDPETGTWTSSAAAQEMVVQQSRLLGSISRLVPRAAQGTIIAASANGPSFLVHDKSAFFAYVPTAPAAADRIQMPLLSLGSGAFDNATVSSFMDANGIHLIDGTGRVSSLALPPQGIYFQSDDLHGYFLADAGRMIIRYALPGRAEKTVYVPASLYEPYAGTGVIGASGRVKLAVHNAQSIYCFDAESGALEWQLDFEKPYQCSRNLRWVTLRDGRAAIIVMLDADILRLDPSTGEIEARLINDRPATAFFFREATSHRDALLLADGNGAGLFDADAMRWIWQEDVPLAAQEIVGWTPDFDNDGIRDLMKAWASDVLMLFSGATGAPLRTFKNLRHSGVVATPTGAALLMTSPDSLEIHRHGRETAVERLDGASVRVLFGGYLLFRKNVGQVALDVRPIDGSPGSGKSVACGACSVSASDFVAVAEARSIRVLDSALNETHAVVSFDENILNVIAFPSLSREAFLVTTISGDVYRVEIGPPAIKSPAWRSD